MFRLKLGFEARITSGGGGTSNTKQEDASVLGVTDFWVDLREGRLERRDIF